jgi:hypothetical protein
MSKRLKKVLIVLVSVVGLLAIAWILMGSVGIFMIFHGSGNYSLDKSSFTRAKLIMVEQRVGLMLPAGSQGLNMFYKGEPMDPYFLAKVEIPQGSQDELLTRINQLPNEDIHVSGSPTTEFDWWKLSATATKAERQFTKRPTGDYIHVALCNEDSHWIVYLEWATP